MFSRFNHSITRFRSNPRARRTLYIRPHRQSEIRLAASKTGTLWAQLSRLLLPALTDKQPHQACTCKTKRLAPLDSSGGRNEQASTPLRRSAAMPTAVDPLAQKCSLSQNRATGKTLQPYEHLQHAPSVSDQPASSAESFPGRQATLHPAALRWTASIVGNRRHIFNRLHIQPSGCQSANRRLTS